MIRGVHAMFYSSEAEALRAFLRDKLGFSATDVGGGWLIFALPPTPECPYASLPGLARAAATPGRRRACIRPAARQRAPNCSARGSERPNCSAPRQRAPKLLGPAAATLSFPAPSAD